jgi:hypothetical protein
MNKPNHRAIRAIVAAVSLLLLIVIGMPLVDEGRELRNEQLAFAELEQEFETTQSRDVRLRRIETKLHEHKIELMNQCVTPARIPQVRDEMIAMIRDCGGSLRALEIENGQTRPWAANDDDPRTRQMPDFGTESEFLLHTHSLSLSVVGSLDAVLSIIEQVNNHHWLMNIDTLSLKPLASGDSQISLEVNITLYGLMRAPVKTEESLVML